MTIPPRKRNHSNASFDVQADAPAKQKRNFYKVSFIKEVMDDPIEYFCHT